MTTLKICFLGPAHYPLPSPCHTSAYAQSKVLSGCSLLVHNKGA